jgi:hypothetical protein
VCVNQKRPWLTEQPSMTKDEIYEHLAQVYLEKKLPSTKDQRKRIFSDHLSRAVLTVLLAALAFYSLTAFLSHRKDLTRRNIIYALSNAPVRIPYNLEHPFPQVKSFSLDVPSLDLNDYHSFNFAVRGSEQGYPDAIKVVITNKRNESSFAYVNGLDLKWNTLSIPFSTFKEITDWTSVSEVSFVLEAWNMTRKKGMILIDEICFAK